MGLARQLLGEGPQDARPGLDEDDPGRLGIEPAKVAGQRPPGDLRQRARQLDAGRAAADHDERGPGPLGLGGGLELGRLEGAQDAPADVQRVAHGLQSGGVGRPLVVSKVGVGHPGRDDEVVVVEVSVLEEDALLLHLDALDGPHEDRDVALAPEQLADWRGDIRGGERRGRHLVEQGLEQVMVALVDQRDADPRDVQLTGRGQATEAATQDDDVGLLFPQHVARTSLVDDRRTRRFREAEECNEG